MILTGQTQNSLSKTIFAWRPGGWVVFVLIATALFTVSSKKSVSAANGLDLDYFKGNWTVVMRNNPAQKFTWSIKEDLNNSWLSGVVEQNGQRISTDFWRINGKKIERFAFTGNSIFVKIESAGWEGNKMIMTGVSSDPSGETKVRETITKSSERVFNAIWEMQGRDGAWTVFADEICTRQVN
jgi:hypothetical protein